MSRTCWTALVVVGLCPLAASAQEYTIRFAKAAPGQVYQVKAENHTEVAIKLLDDGGGTKFEKNEVKGQLFIFREVGLERGPGGDLVKLKRTYKKARRTTDGDRRTLPFQGETVLIEKKDGDSTFQIIGDEAVEGDDARELREEFNKGGGIGKLVERFLPRQAVKVDDTWKVDAAAMAMDFMKDGKIEIDAARSTGSGKLLKVYTKDGAQFGVIELTITLPVTALINDGNKTPTKKGTLVLKIETDRRIDGGIGASEVRFHLEGEIRGGITSNGMDLGLEVNINARSEEHRTPAAK